MLSPDFRTDVGFVRRTDQRRNVTTLGYRFWPESWLINWGPSVTYGRSWSYDDVLEDESLRASLNATFANNISASVSVNRDMERYLGVNFHKESYRAFGRVSSSRKFSVGGSSSTATRCGTRRTRSSAAAAAAGCSPRSGRCRGSSPRST